MTTVLIGHLVSLRVAAVFFTSSRAVISYGANIFRNRRLRVDLSNKKNRKGIRALVMEISLVTWSIGGNFFEIHYNSFVK